jgi:outer membrane protein assembly factor BamA
VKVKDKQDLPMIGEEYDLSLLRIGTVVDSKNSYPFPTEGVGMDFAFEFAIDNLLGADVNYNALRAKYETFITWGKRHTLRPILTVGFADETMPFGEQFRLGGREMMFGTREDDRRGRQLLLLNMEYRFFFPFQILFDTYLRFRYDLGTISEIPEQIKFSAFRHGIGAELALDTPIGPGSIGAGKSFYFQQTSAGSTIQHGPVLFYFMIGYEL